MVKNVVWLHRPDTHVSACMGHRGGGKTKQNKINQRTMKIGGGEVGKVCRVLEGMKRGSRRLIKFIV